MNPIFYYCKEEVAGWYKLPFSMFPFSKEEEPYFCSFLQAKEGMQITCSIKKNAICPILHVSLAPVLTLRKELSESQLVEEILAKSVMILKEFFGNLDFVRMPDDAKKPAAKHFFHYLSHYKEN